MSKKTKNSRLSRIASQCGLFYIGALFIVAFSPFIDSSGILIFLGGIVVAMLGIAGIVLGIIALYRMTPEEKAERLWTSGTTKNLAAVGIAVPPAMTIVFALIGFLVKTTL